MNRRSKRSGIFFFGITHGFRQNGKAKLNYAFGVIAIVIVVAVLTISDSVEKNAPVVFLAMAQEESGESDVEMRPYYSYHGFNTTLLDIVSQPLNMEVSYAPRYVDTRVSFSVLKECLVNQVNDSDAILSSDAIYTLPEALFNETIPLDDEGCPRPRDFRWKDIWYNETTNSYHNCSFSSSYSYSYGRQHCLTAACGELYGADIVAIDFEREKKIGIDPGFPLEAPDFCACYVSEALALTANLTVNDTIILTTPGRRYNNYRFVANSLYRATYSGYNNLFVQVMNYPIRVQAIYGPNRKLPNADDVTIMMDLHAMSRIMGRYMEPYVTTKLFDWMEHNNTVQDWANRLEIRFDERNEQIYSSTDSDKVTSSFLNILARFLFYTDFTRVRFKYTLMESYLSYASLALYVTIVIQLVVGVMTGISILLIYGLMVVGVQKMTFELGVLRVVGMRKVGVAVTLMSQALTFSLPAVVIGVLVARFGTRMVLREVFGSLVGQIDTSVAPKTMAWVVPFAILIPVLASFGPIRQALGSKLIDALDTNRTLAQAPVSTYNMDRSKVASLPLELPAAGLVFAIFGFILYYLFPRAMFTGEIILLSSILLLILGSLLGGLVLIGINFENIFETMTYHLFLWWEDLAIRRLALHNAIVHRGRNAKTIMLFGTGTGLIIFMSVFASIFLEQQSGRTLQIQGSELVFNVFLTSSIQYRAAQEMEKAMRPYVNDTVQSWTWKTDYLAATARTRARFKYQELNQYYQAVRVQGLGSNFFDVTLSDRFLIRHAPLSLYSNTTTENEYGLAGHFYSTEGRGHIIAGASVPLFLGLEESNMNGSAVGEEFILDFPADQNNKQLMYLEGYGAPVGAYTVRIKGGMFLDQCPGIELSQYPTAPIVEHVDAAVSIPAIVKMARLSSVEEMHYKAMIVKLFPNATRDRILKMERAVLRSVRRYPVERRYVRVRDKTYNDEEMGDYQNMIFQIFYALTALVTGISFFALSASTRASVFESRRQIAVLRAVGVGRFRIFRVFAEEAFLVVMAAQLIGVFVGYIVGYTLGANFAMIAESEIPFVLPWDLIGLIFGCALFVSLLATAAPIYKVVKQPISTVIRDS